MAAEAPWHAVFPAPKDAELGAVDREEVLQMIKDADKGAQDFVLVDVRRNDHEVSIFRLISVACSRFTQQECLGRWVGATSC